jgi:hypothetical protein
MLITSCTNLRWMWLVSSTVPSLFSSRANFEKERATTYCGRLRCQVYLPDLICGETPTLRASDSGSRNHLLGASCRCAGAQVLTLPKKDQIREDKVKQARHTRPPQSVIARSPMSLLSDAPRSDNDRARCRMVL